MLSGMETRRIGSLDVSVVGLGCNNFGGRIDEAATRKVVDAALDVGITCFDTADIYGGTKSEEFLGRALGARRDDVIVATKFGVPINDERKGGATAAYIRLAVEDSLRRLGTDRVDLYQLHFPDQNTPLDETLGALDELVRAGKVREIGCSNFTPEMLDESEGISQARDIARFVSVQNEYSLLRRLPERGVLQACERDGIAFIPYFPLASGLLTGKYRRDEAPPEGTRLASMPAERQADMFSDKNMNRVEALDGWARQHGHSLLELAFTWLLAHRVVATVIAGATRPEQVHANAAAASWSLTQPDLDEIDVLLRSNSTS
jgi:aryl-alcohol dehydrogenase-like predicted oxidoreductase